jgi:hypothetical protein
LQICRCGIQTRPTHPRVIVWSLGRFIVTD